MDAALETTNGLLAQMLERLDELAGALAHPRQSGPPIDHRNIGFTFAGADSRIVIPATTRRLNVIGIVLVNREAADVTFLCGAREFGPFPLAANSGFEAGWKGRDVTVFPVTWGEDFAVRVSGATTLGGIVAYFED